MASRGDKPNKLYDELSPNQLKAIELIVFGAPTMKVAKECKVTQRTIWNWRNINPLFRQEEDRRKREIYEEFRGSLRGMIAKATKNLIGLLENPETPAPTGLKAIELIANICKPETPKVDIIDAVKVLTENNAIAPEALEEISSAFNEFQDKLKGALKK